MKVGDLVMLSAHGQTLVMASHRKGKVGIIVEKKPLSSFALIDPLENEYKIQWLDRELPFDGFIYHRRDLKLAKITKNNADKSGGFGSRL